MAQLIRHGPCHVSNALQNYESITGSHDQPCRIQMKTSQHQKMPCKLICFPNYLRLLSIGTQWQHGCNFLIFFAYPTSIQDAKTIAKVINNIMTIHAYLPSTFISDKGSVFMSQVIKKLAEVLGNTIRYATTKHAQTVGMLEWTHA